MATSLVKEWLSSGIGCKRFFQLLALRTQNQHYTGDLQMWSACYREDVEVTLQQLSTTHEDHMHDHQEDVDDSSSDLLLLVCIWELLEGLYWTDAGSTKFIEWHVKYFATEHEPSQTISMDGLHHLTATFVCATIQYNMEVAYLCIQELHEKSKQLHHDTTRNYFIQERYEESIDMFCYWIKAAPAMQDGSTDAFLTWQQEAVHIADSFRELIDDEDTIKESPYAFLYAVWRVLQMVAGGEDALADLIECCSLDHLWWMTAYLSYFNHQTLRVDRFSFDAVLRCARTDFHKTSNARVHYFDRLYDLVETVTEGLPDSKDNTLSSQALSNVARVLDRMSHAQTTRIQNEMDFLTQWMRAHLFDAIVNPFGNQSISDVRRRDDAIQKYAQLLATAQPLMALKYLATAPTLDPSVLCAIVDNLEQINPMHGILTIQQIRTDMDAYLAPTSYHRISLKNYFGSSLPGKDCERWVRLVITHGAELLNEAFVHLLRRISEETSLPLFFMYCIEIKQRDSNCAAVDAHMFNRFASSSVRELSAIGAALQHHVYGEATEECARHFPLFVASWIYLSFLVYQALELHNHEALHQVLNSIQLTHTMAQDILDHIDSNSVPQRTTAHIRRKLYELRCITQISPSSIVHKALH